VAVNLTKGARVSLVKENPGLNKIVVGLGWDEAPKSGKKGGLLGALFGGGGAAIDCDASVFMLDSNDKMQELIYFGALKSRNLSVIHTGDNLTGEGAGDDEQIKVNLAQVPAEIKKLVFVVNIYDCKGRKQHFGMIRNAFVRVVNENTGKELLKFNLTENYDGKTALVVSEIYRKDGDWKFAAIGEGTNDFSLADMKRRYS
jgi:stress response protein SCP2